MKQFSRERGAVLITGLVLLVVLTILGLQAMRNSSLEEQMAGNVRSENIAFQASEAGLREAERWLATRTGKPDATSDGSSGVWLLDAPDPNTSNRQAWWQDWTESHWTGSGATSYSRSLSFASGADLDAVPPRYVVEERQVVQDSLNTGQPQDYSGRQFYQVTSRGRDVSGRMRVIARTTYARRY